MILISAFSGILAAAIIYSGRPFYDSTAKLLVHYVADRKAIMTVGEGDQIRAPDFTGAAIMNAEIEILTSWDLAAKVAEVVGPERISGIQEATNGLEKAARVIQKSLRTDVPNRGNIIEVTFHHPTPDVVREVMTNLIDHYLSKHVEVHRAVAVVEFLRKETEHFREKLMQTEEELRRRKNQAGVVSLDESRKSLASEMAAVRQTLMETETALAERRATAPLTGATNGVSSKSNQVATLSHQSAEEIERFRVVCERLNALRAKEIEMLGRLTEENPQVASLRKQLAEWEEHRKKLVAANPTLTSMEAAAVSANGRSNETVVAVTPTVMLEARLKVWTEQYEKLKKDADALFVAENEITRLTRTKELEEANLRHFSTLLEQARIDTTLEANKISSISIAQAPSPPLRSRAALRKPAAMVLAAGVLGGLALAFLLEFLLDPSVKRPVEIESGLRLPLLMTIPFSTRGDGLGRSARRKAARGAARLTKGASPPGEGRPAEVALWDPQHALRPYYEALRDRILMQFENVARRPKLVGLTSCSTGSGVTTLATGLAAAMSESGQGKVLLVDLNADNGSLHAFTRGQPACALTEALQPGGGESTAVQGSLVLASTAPHPLLSRTLLEAMPKLKTSDYDYVIFDLPPISQTSITLRLASYMDEVMLVAEAQKTHKGLLQKAYSLLTQSQANVRTILNKRRNYVPDFIQQEL